MAHSNLETEQPMVVKYVETEPSGVRSQTLARCAIGYVLHGTKHIHSGDTRKSLTKGDMFFLGVGLHYTEELPESDRPFEQIVFYYTPEELQRILLHLNITYRLDISNEHQCSECRSGSEVVMAAWPSVRNIFVSAGSYLREECTLTDPAAARFKMAELIYNIVSHEDCCLKSKVLCSIDAAKEGFEQTVYEHIFRDCSIEELARETNRSLTSFKKEFRRVFSMPPHKWFIRQRLIHSRLLLLSTSLSISEIGVRCSFPNTSHFIKLFKKFFGLTPAYYRNSRQEPLPLTPGAAPNVVPGEELRMELQEKIVSASAAVPQVKIS